ncbi:hypothetical protein B0H10DRAFT_1411390 [Mycena sp. CBHHK59/15]|nr:hypothetical protein B0H10DRAFT_1411390 [Mycena sp. CBHHK59/15]
MSKKAIQKARATARAAKSAFLSALTPTSSAPVSRAATPEPHLGERSVSPAPLPKGSVKRNVSPSTSTQIFTGISQDTVSSSPAIQISDVSTSIRSQDALSATSPATFDASSPTLTSTAIVSAPDIVRGMLSPEDASRCQPSYIHVNPSRGYIAPT